MACVHRVPGLARLLNNADVGGGDAPAVGGPDPRLHLAADLAWSVGAAEERCGHREIAAERGDDGAFESPRKTTGERFARKAAISEGP